MSNFIENNPAIIIVFSIVLGVSSLLVAGVCVGEIASVAVAGSKILFKLIIFVFVGVMFTVMPIVALYGIIDKKETQLRHRGRLNRVTGEDTPRRRGEAEHWRTDDDDDDDLDGDGIANDSLRRLGAIE